MRGDPIVFPDYAGGVNLEASPYSIDANQARYVLNISSTPIGSVRKRNGFEPIASPGLPITSLGTYERTSTKVLVAVGDNGTTTSLTRYSPTGVATNIKAALVITPGRKWDIIQAPVSGGQGPVYLLNGSDPPIQWTGTGDAALWTPASGSLPNGKYMVYHDNRVLVAGVETNVTTRSTLYASSLADPRVWDSPNGVTTLFDPDDGEDITGLGTVGPYALVFKARKAFIITDTETLAYRNISDQIGCVSHRSIANSDIGTFFLTSDRTVCVTDGTETLPISVAIEPLLRNIPDDRIQDAVGFMDREKYYLSISTSAENNYILEYDTRTSGWWIHAIYLDSDTYTGVSDWALLDPHNSATLYAAGASVATPKLFKAFVPGVTVDNGSQVYPAYWVTGWNTFGQPHINKVVTQIRTDARGYFDLYTAKSFAPSFTSQEQIMWEASISDDSTFGGEGTFGGDGTFGGTGGGVYESRFYTPGTARAWSLKFESVNSLDWELFSHTIGVENRTD